VDKAEAHFDPFGDSFNFSARMVQQAWKSLWDPMVLLCNVCQVDACFGLFGIVLASAQDRCVVYTKCTTGMEVILGTPDGTSR
jgi:hypothetical protein